ncbi:tyrosine-protein phosphatase [Zavarzinia compransoris]|uniref:Protein-tyrosine-phosphatase n=1 Tax=Zavarzinia compransoris TaxID=1264899 RepID=A0A317DVZ2_9PROT|nr:tyrosine-protein phosphatase [Zavarzinia compransoris]PWR18877.1 protein-tyrosine-phosphatase [Zavarzinia compransoris]TDP48872.1 protein tyrosine/serine phosphatase [Zavarzinia compransoris]
MTVVAGLTNFRDFGGYAAAGGRRLARGRLFRSAGLSALSDRGVDDLGRLNLGLLVDLRHPHERLREPSRLPAAFAGRVLATEGAAGGDAAHLAGLISGLADGGEGRRMMLDYYRHAPFSEDRRDLFARAITALAETEGAALIHCTAGKDRTGLLVALIQHLLGVARADIIAEYMRSLDALAELEAASSRWLIAQNLPGDLGPGVMRAFAGVDPAYIEAGLDAIEAACGTVDAYCRDLLGLGPAVRDRLAARLYD